MCDFPVATSADSDIIIKARNRNQEDTGLKKLLYTVLLAGMLLSLTACKQSELKSSEGGPSMAVEETKEKLHYIVPQTTPAMPEELRTKEGIGPDWVQIDPEKEYELYPDDKKPTPKEEQEQGTLVCVYMIQDGLVNQTFDIVEEVNAETLTDCLIKNAVLKSDASVVSFENRNGAGTLELTALTSGYYKAREEVLLACIGNTFIENLELDTLELKVAGKTYGPMEFTYEYDYH